MVITREGEDGAITIVDKVREMVRLGAGLDEAGKLSLETQSKALACLSRFRQRLKSIPDKRIRAVGTNTFRAAKNSTEFLVKAQQALGHPISIISGHEEARLVYLGAAFDLSVSHNQRLVVDIGGGSTEITIGKGYNPFLMDSLYMGCVSMTRRIFKDGVITSGRINQAQQFVRHELETVLGKYLSAGWDEVVGTSGTIKAIDEVSRQLGVANDWISPEGLDALEKWIVQCGDSDNLIHVSEQRRPVFVGGFVILATIVRDLGIQRMDISQGALREGVAYDLVGRLHNQDSRFAGVNALVNQFQPDLQQIERVKHLANIFLEKVSGAWKFDADIEPKLIIWASQLHEVGMSISYTHHHLHSAYIVENADIDGFSRQVQRALAFMVGNSRQKIDQSQSEELSWKVMRLTVLLRLAIAFFRGRVDTELSGVDLSVKGKKILLAISDDWAKGHPLTMFDLETEKVYLAAAGFKLKLKLV
jgi:exopolyphosphatase/guanosine-5'-triphosphate,3'-diphosphate pyrophosphatase